MIWMILAVWGSITIVIVALCRAVADGDQRAARHPDYWQGFADGELHQRLNDRDPSDN